MRYINNKQAPVIPELIPTQLKDCEGADITPLTSIYTLYDGSEFFLKEFNDKAVLIEQIFGDGIDVEIEWNLMQDNIRWLLDVFNEPPIVIEQELRPKEQRNHRQLYFKSNIDISKLVRGPVGVRIDLEKGTITRLGAAVGKSIDDFYHILPWAGMRRCCLRDEGIVDKYFNELGYTDDGSRGQCMVEIPMFYYKRVPTKIVDGSLIIWEDWISYDAVDGYYVHPSFVRDDGTVRDKIYIGAYKASKDASNNLYSVVSDSINVSLTLSECRVEVSKRGKNWKLYSITHHSMIQSIFLIAFASFDSQSCVGDGHITSGGAGKTSLMGSKCGTTDNCTNLFGIEDLWSYQSTVLDGIFVDETIYLSNNSGTNSEPLSFVFPKYLFSESNKLYTSNFGYDESHDYLYLTKQCSLTNQFIPDIYVSNNSLTNSVVSTGYNSNSPVKDNGLFLLNTYDNATVKAAWLGYRICYLP